MTKTLPTKLAIATGAVLLSAALLAGCSKSAVIGGTNPGNNTNNNAGQAPATSATPAGIPVDAPYTTKDGYTLEITGTLPLTLSFASDPKNASPGQTVIDEGQSSITMTINNTTGGHDYDGSLPEMVPIYDITSPACTSFQYSMYHYTAKLVDTGASANPMPADPDAAYCAPMVFEFLTNTASVQLGRPTSGGEDLGPIPGGGSQQYSATAGFFGPTVAEADAQNLVASLNQPVGWVFQYSSGSEFTIFWASPGLPQLTTAVVPSAPRPSA